MKALGEILLMILLVVVYPVLSLIWFLCCIDLDKRNATKFVVCGTCGLIGILGAIYVWFGSQQENMVLGFLFTIFYLAGNILQTRLIIKLKKKFV